MFCIEISIGIVILAKAGIYYERLNKEQIK